MFHPVIFYCRSDDYVNIVQGKDNIVIYIGSNHVKAKMEIHHSLLFLSTMVKRNSREKQQKIDVFQFLPSSV